MAKYSKDGAFNDPVVRCDSCGKIVNMIALKEMGCCPYCGNRKVRNVMQFTGEELDKMREWKIDPEFVALFEQVPEAVPV